VKFYHSLALFFIESVGYFGKEIVEAGMTLTLVLNEANLPNSSTMQDGPNNIHNFLRYNVSSRSLWVNLRYHKRAQESPTGNILHLTKLN